MENLANIIEGILFVAGDSVTLFDIADKLNIDINEVKEAVKTLQAKHKSEASGIQVLTFNDKVQLSSNSAYSEEIASVLNPIKEKALTRAVLEVAAIVAYKQPVTRLDVDNIRGVNSDYAITMLLENGLIDVVGRKDTVGKPLLFGTTDKFLKKFNLEGIHQLPDYNELLERIEVLHSPKDNSLFNFTDVAEDIESHANEEIDLEKLKQQVISDSSDLSDILDKDVSGDYVNYAEE